MILTVLFQRERDNIAAEYEAKAAAERRAFEEEKKRLLALAAVAAVKAKGSIEKST